MTGGLGLGARMLGICVNASKAGRPNRVTDLATNRSAVGKFGWKGQNLNLKQFAADAYLNEMGITSPLFPNENCPQGNCAVLTACDLVQEPEDDGSGVQAFTDFMTFLAPPPPLCAPTPAWDGT